MGDYGLKISKPGVNVKDATDEELYFSSKFDSVKAKIVNTVSMTFLAANTTQNLDISHGLSYTPKFFVLVKLTGSVAVPLRYVNLFGELDARVSIINAFSDTSKIRITVSGSSGVSDVVLNFKYYIFYNQLD